MIEISINTIKIVLNNLIEKISEGELKSFYFKDDYYWSVPEEKLTDITAQPNLLVGSLKDDINFLNSIVEDDFDANYLELERLSSIFRFLSIQLTN
jgi:hypothetical protein